MLSPLYLAVTCLSIISLSSFVVTVDCEIINSSVRGAEYVGGFIGIAGGNSGVYSQIFSKVSVTNCVIKNSSIGGKAAGGIVGMSTSDAWTKTTISDCAVVNNRITSTSDKIDNAGIVVGEVGVAGEAKTVKGTMYIGGTYLNNIIENENSVLSYNAYVDRLYGCQGQTSAKLYVDGENQFK